MYDVFVVGGGPAGLNAALILGRCRRRCLLCDSAAPDNAASHALHGFLSRDGTPPLELVRRGREQLSAYKTVEVCADEALEITVLDCGFEVLLRSGRRVQSRKLLLATGLLHPLPEVAGLKALYGRSVFHCPYCDGWEMRDQPLAILAEGRHGVHFALEMLLWSRDLILCTNGSGPLHDKERARLTHHGIKLREERIERLEAEDGILRRLVFDTGPPLPRRALFFSTEPYQHSRLAERLGCQANASGKYPIDDHGESTQVPGLYLAGDAAGGVRLAVVAAAEGARAAVALNTILLKEDYD